MPEDTADTSGAPTRDLAYDHIERGIAAAEKEDLETAIEELSEAERIAVELDAADLAAAARINMGYAHWAKGDIDEARRYYAEGAEIARDNDDPERLKSALLNFAAASRQDRRWEEAVIAYDEYLTLEIEDSSDIVSAHIDCGLSLVEMADFTTALAHMEEAERIAQDAGLTELVITARIDQGVVTEKSGNREDAFGLYSDAAKMAREAGNDELLAAAVASEAFARRPVDYSEADPLFTQAEDLYRSLGKRTELANTLYWHAVMLKDAGIRDRAVGTWREEEAIRRELDQHTDLGDCLLGQASVLREREEWLNLETIYSQAADAYERGGSSAGLAETRLLQSRLLRTTGRADEAIERSEAALSAAIDAGLIATECRVHGLRAMLFAEKGDTTLAREELDLAESTSMSGGLTEQATWAIARRAYVMAHQGEAPEEVTLQLQTAYQYGIENDRARLGKRAALRMISEIKANCDAKYAEPLDALKTELRAKPADASPTPTEVEAPPVGENEPNEVETRGPVSQEEARENESE